MDSRPGRYGLLRQILSSGALVLMLIGLLLVPFVSIGVALGIALGAGALFLLVKILER